MESTRLRCMTAVYLTSGERILLLYRTGSRVIGDSWTGTAGGHFEPEELNDPRACVLRELREETGLGEDDLDGLTLRYVTLRLKNGEIRQNYYYFAELKEPDRSLSSCEGRLRWFRLSEIAGLPMPFSARCMILHYLETGRFDSMLYGGISEASGTVFTELKEF